MNLKTFIAVGSATLVAVVGYSTMMHYIRKDDRARALSQQPPQYFFESMGEIKLENMWNGQRTIDIECADMDGDGDLDLIVSDGFHPIHIYENRIPQKEK